MVFKFLFFVFFSLFLSRPLNLPELFNGTSAYMIRPIAVCRPYASIRLSDLTIMCYN